MEVNDRSFGILIAYVIPGWILLLGVGYWFGAVGEWIGGSVASSPSIGGFLFSTLASIGLGVLASTLRWLIVDTAMRHLGVQPISVPFSRLRNRHEAFLMLVDGHYRYYQFHGNLLVVLPIAALLRWTHGLFAISEMFAGLVVMCLLFVGAKDALAKYVQRTEQLLRSK